MFAIVEISGKQYKVRENDRLYVPRLKDEPESKISFDRVLLVAGDEIKVGTPTVEGAQIEATVLSHVKADKVVVFKKKRRKRYQVKNGHRQPYTQILIDGVSLDGKGTPKKAAKAKPTAAETKPATAKAAPAEAKPAAAKAAPAEAKPAAATKETAPKKAAPKSETTKVEKAKAAPKKATKAKKTGDDLTKIEGVGPKIAGILADGGLDTFKKLAAADLDAIKALLEEAGPRYNIAVPDTWSEQAALAEAGDWDGLKKLQDSLDGGRRVDA